MSPWSAEVLNRKTSSDEINCCCAWRGRGSTGQGPPGSLVPTLCSTDMKSPSSFWCFVTNARLLPGLCTDTRQTRPLQPAAWCNGTRRGAKEIQTLNTRTEKHFIETCNTLLRKLAYHCSRGKGRNKRPKRNSPSLLHRNTVLVHWA